MWITILIKNRSLTNGLAGPRGFEPLIFSVTGRRQLQACPRAHFINYNDFLKILFLFETYNAFFLKNWHLKVFVPEVGIEPTSRSYENPVLPLNYTGEFYGFPNLARFSFFLCDQPCLRSAKSKCCAAPNCTEASSFFNINSLFPKRMDYPIPPPKFGGGFPL